MEHFKGLPRNWIFTYKKSELEKLAAKAGVKIEADDTKDDIVTKIFDFQMQEYTKSSEATGGKTKCDFSDLTEALKENSVQMANYVHLTHKTLHDERTFFQDKITEILDTYSKQERSKKINIPYFKHSEDRWI